MEKHRVFLREKPGRKGVHIAAMGNAVTFALVHWEYSSQPTLHQLLTYI